MRKSPKVTMTTRVDPKLKLAVRKAAKIQGIKPSRYIELALSLKIAEESRNRSFVYGPFQVMTVP